jgi:hypothetical protein
VAASLLKEKVHRWLKPVPTNRWVWIIVLTLSGWFCRADAQVTEFEEPFRVLILRNTSQYVPAAIIQDRGMRDAFSALKTRNVELFIETMDTLWFERSEIEPEFLSLFRKKYGNRKIDLLIAAGADALDIAQRLREVVLRGYLSSFTISRKTRCADVRFNRILPASSCASTCLEHWPWRCVCSRMQSASSL